MKGEEVRIGRTAEEGEGERESRNEKRDTIRCSETVTKEKRTKSSPEIWT